MFQTIFHFLKGPKKRDIHITYPQFLTLHYPPRIPYTPLTLTLNPPDHISVDFVLTYIWTSDLWLCTVLSLQLGHPSKCCKLIIAQICWFNKLLDSDLLLWQQINQDWNHSYVKNNWPAAYTCMKVHAFQFTTPIKQCLFSFPTV